MRKLFAILSALIFVAAGSVARPRYLSEIMSPESYYMYKRYSGSAEMSLTGGLT